MNNLKEINFINKHVTLFLAGIMVIQAILVISTFYPISGIYNKEEIYVFDFPLIHYWAHCGRYFFSQYKKFWGYDPYFMAGYPLDFLLNNSVVVQVCATIFYWLPIVWVVKSFYLFVIMLIPLFLYLSCRNFDLNNFESFIGTIIGFTYCRLGLLSLLFCGGAVTGGFISYLFIYVYSLFFRYFEREEFKIGLSLCIFAPLALLIHRGAMLILPMPILFLLLSFIKKLSKKNYFFIISLIILTLSINFFWLYPFIKFMHYKTLIATPILRNFDVYRPLKDYFTFKASGACVLLIPNTHGTTIIRDILLFLGIYGLILWKKAKKDGIFIAFVGSIIYIFLLSYYGSFWEPLGIAEPYRNIIVLNLLFLIPATFALSHIFKKIFDKYSRLGFWITLTILFILVISLNLTIKSYQFTMKLYPRYTILADNDFERLCSWINSNITNKSRILIEDANGGTNIYHHGYLLAFLPLKTKRQFIGGPEPFYSTKHHFAAFQDGILFEKEITLYSLDKLKEYFDLYNIGWVVCWSERSQKVFDQYPEYLIRKEKIDKFAIYSVNREPSFFIKGKGNISADYNRIILKDVIPEDNEIIIKYHWMETLRAKPPLKIERVYLMDDPIGFIKVIDPPSDFEIYNSYKF